MILLKIQTQFANTLFNIASAKYLANLYNQKLYITFPYGSIVIKEKKYKPIDIKNDLAYNLMFDKYWNNIINYDEQLINENFISLPNKNKDEFIDHLVIENNKNYYLGNRYLSFNNFNRDREFIKKEFDFLFNDKLLNEINNIINLNTLKKCNIVHFRLLYEPYRNWSCKYFFDYGLYKQILSENKYNIFLSDDIDLLNEYLDNYNIDKTNIIFLNTPHFLYDFISMMYCKNIYCAMSTFPLFAGFINNIPLYHYIPNIRQMDYMEYENTFYLI